MAPKGNEIQSVTGLKAVPEVQPLIKNEKAIIVPAQVDTPVSSKSTTFSPLLRQTLATAGPITAIISSGMTSGFSAILLPQLQHHNSSITINQDQASWIASVAVLPMALGCILSGILMERLGRKMTHQLVCLPFVVGWLTISVTPNLACLYLGRFLTGLSVGLIGPSSTVFIAEVSGPQYRGVFLAAISLAIAFGILFTHILGTFLDWQLTAGLSTIFPVICFIIVSLVPESPTWLAAKGRTKDAEETFGWFRGYSDEATKELNQLIKKYRDERAREAQVKEDKQRLNELMKHVFQASFIKPFFIMITYFFVMQFSGVNAIAFYTVTMLEDVGSGINEYAATIIIDVVRVIMSVVACILLRRYGRRPLTTISGLGTAISLLGLAMYLCLCGPDLLQSLAWVPMVFLISYICFISIGFVPLPWVMIGEVFPSAVRGLGSGGASSFGFLMFFAVVKTSPTMFANLGVDGTFFTYGGISLLGTVFLYLCLPETKNRTLQDIEDGYRRHQSHQVT